MATDVHRPVKPQVSEASEAAASEAEASTAETSQAEALRRQTAKTEAPQAREFFRTDVIVVCLVVYAFLGLTADVIVRILERLLLQWRPTFTGQ